MLADFLQFNQSYLKSIMSQERQIGLTEIAVEGDIALSLNSEKLVATSAAQIVRSQIFIRVI
jgi:hypothetical protein